jgi:hypothetical protein
MNSLLSTSTSGITTRIEFRRNIDKSSAHTKELARMMDRFVKIALFPVGTVDVVEMKGHTALGRPKIDMRTARRVEVFDFVEA